MKYLVLNTTPVVAIPLDALASGAHELKFLDYEWVGNVRVYRYDDKRRIEGEIVNQSEILQPAEEKV